MSAGKHLWEYDHPYYCGEGCYYVPGTRWDEVHGDWSSWADFSEEWGDVDPDYNLLFRWDWKRPDPEDYSYEASEPGFVMPGDTLELFFFLQRKARPFSHRIQVTESDEESIRAWLTLKAEHMRSLWQPFIDQVSA